MDKVRIRFNPSWESRPSGTVRTKDVRTRSLDCFNPSWESRPSGTIGSDPGDNLRVSVSTPHGRAVPLEPIAPIHRRRE